jgi:flagellar assembly protein FliH
VIAPGDGRGRRVVRQAQVEGTAASLALAAPVRAASSRVGPVDPVTAARGEAEALLAAASVEAEAIREAARARGYAEGREQAERELGEAIRRVSAVAADIDRAREKVMEALAPRLADVAVRVAGIVAAGEIRQDPGRIRAIVHEALQAVREDDRITVRLHPADLASLSPAQAELERACGVQLVLRADRSLVRGSCLIDTSRGLVDARLDSKLAALHSALAEPAAS